MRSYRNSGNRRFSGIGTAESLSVSLYQIDVILNSYSTVCSIFLWLRQTAAGVKCVQEYNALAHSPTRMASAKF